MISIVIGNEGLFPPIFVAKIEKFDTVKLIREIRDEDISPKIANILKGYQI